MDNLDDVLARMKVVLRLPLGAGGETVAVPVNSMDDFHPDQLVENVELFETLLDLRRNLGSKAGFGPCREGGAVLVRGGSAAPAPRRRPRGCRRDRPPPQRLRPADRPQILLAPPRKPRWTS